MSDVKKMTVTQWRDEVYLPWKASVADYLKDREANQEKMVRNVETLQTIVGLLLDGKGRQAVAAWNALDLHPKLIELQLSGDGEALTMKASDGRVQVMRVDELIKGLEAMLGQAAPRAGS